MQTQALYGQQVVVLARSGGWAKVAIVDEPDPQDPHGYPGWLPVSQLAQDFDRAGVQVVVRSRKSQLLVRGRTVPLSYGTSLPLVNWSGDAAVVRTPDGVGTAVGVERAAEAVRLVDPRPGEALHRPALPLGRALSVGLRLLRPRLGRLPCARHDDPARRRSAVPSRNTGAPRRDLRAGDLLFWGSPSYAEHVAIYAGAGKMIEAPDSAHSVRVVPVRWDRFYLGARRYLSS